MKYNLTSSQKEAIRWVVAEVQGGRIQESFLLQWLGDFIIIDDKDDPVLSEKWKKKVDLGKLRAAAAAGLLHLEESKYGVAFTLTGLAYHAVKTDFAEDQPPQLPSASTHSNPPEIAISLDRFRAKYTDPNKVGFLIMRFSAAKAFGNIVDVIRDVGQKHGLAIIRADENEFHADLWGNVRTHLHGCSFGIAVYERIETDEPNANVGLEVGYLLAMGKPVLLLKDRTVAALQADLAGKLYKPFDPHDPIGTIPQQLEKWLCDNGVVVPKPTMKS